MSESDVQLRKLLKQQVKLLETVDPEYLECRVGATGHRWTRCQPDVAKPAGQNVRVDQCDHCTMIRRTYSGAKYGEIVKRQYVVPDNYYLHRPDEFIGRLSSPAAVRLVTATTPDGLPEVQAIRTSE